MSNLQHPHDDHMAADEDAVSREARELYGPEVVAAADAAFDEACLVQAMLEHKASA